MPNQDKYNLTTLYFPYRVRDKLAQITVYPMTIVEAPSGFGKTTAVKAFFRTYIDETVRVYWYTFLGETFSASWKNLCEILGRADPESGKKLLELGTPDEDSLPLITEILENMECAEETYLVLDNCQDIKVSFVRRLFETFAKQGGERLHVVVITQQLSVEGTLMAVQNHRVYRVFPQDLTFTKTDAANYYKQVGLRITSGQLDSVYARSDGWIAALYLQMLAYVQTGSFEGGDMETLIHTALWSKLSLDEQKMLLMLSVFPSFTLPQLEFMTGRPAELSRITLRENPFIRFDEETHCYYMHSILKTYLLRIFAEEPLEAKREIYMRGGDWFAKNASYLNALRFYHMADAYERIFALPLTSLDVADNSVGEDIRPIVFDLIDKTDIVTKRRYPYSIINVAFALFFLGEHERLMRMQQEIGSIIDGCDASEKEKNVLRGEMELLMSFLDYNRIDKMSEKHRKALALIGGSTSFISNKSTWTFGSPSILYMYYRESGKLVEELAQMDECMPYYYQLSDGHGSGSEIVIRAEAEFYCGNLDAAETLCHKALFVSDSKKQNSIYLCGLFLLARIAVMRGDMAALHAALQTLQERAKLNQGDLCRNTLDLCEGFISILLNETENLPAWLAQGNLSEKHLSMMVVPFAHILYGRALLEQKEYLKLLGASEYFMGMAGIFPNLLTQIYINLYRAQASAALGKEEDAVRFLTDALQTALPDKLYMPFVENDEGIHTLLPLAAQWIGDRKGMAKISELSHAFRQSIRQLRTDKLVLSVREKEVALLAVQGLSNKEIAERLFLSMGTVKTLMSRIFQKLNIQSRVQLKERKF